MTFSLQRAKMWGYLLAQLVAKIFNICDHDPPTSQTDGQTTCDSKTALCTIVHLAVKITGCASCLLYSTVLRSRPN